MQAKSQSIERIIDHLSEIPIYLKGGSVIAFQNVTEFNSNAV